MRKVSLSPGNLRNIVFFLIAALVVVADQLSKAWIGAHLPRGSVLFDLGLFQIGHFQNTGAAFGLFHGLTQVLGFVSAIGVVIILICAFVLPRHLPFLGMLSGKVALGLVLGGTVGNMVDRFRLGYVIDFIDFGFWPAFNFADSAVTIGALWLGFSLLSRAVAERK